MAPERNGLTRSGLSPETMTLLLILELPPRDAYMLSNGCSLLCGVHNVLLTQFTAPLVQCWSFFRVVFLKESPPLLSKCM